MNCLNLWGSGALRFNLQLTSLKIDLNMHMLVQGPDPSGSRFADPPPVLR